MQQFGFNLMANEAIQSVAMRHYVYMPLANTFTLGIYGLVAPSDTDSTVAASPQSPSSDR